MKSSRKLEAEINRKRIVKGDAKMQVKVGYKVFFLHHLKFFQPYLVDRDTLTCIKHSWYIFLKVIPGLRWFQVGNNPELILPK